jgi:hypothetical protein
VEGGEWPGFPAPPAGPSGSETSKSDEDRAVFRLHRWDTLFSGNKTLYQIRQHLRLVMVHHVPGVFYLGDFYLRHVLPKMAGAVTGDKAAYVYLNETIEQFPNRSELAAEIQAAGFDQVSARGLTFGIVALHEARAGSAPVNEV